MSDLYVCKKYETPYEEGYRVVRTIEEHNKIIYNQALEDMANRIKEYSGEHYIDCDGYYGRQTELVFRTEEFLDDVLSELKK